MTVRWRGDVETGELETLHATCFGAPSSGRDWRAQLERHSLGWVCGRGSGGELVGFVNVAWDGGTHALLLDPMVAPTCRRRGIGRERA